MRGISRKQLFAVAVLAAVIALSLPALATAVGPARDARSPYAGYTIRQRQVLERGSTRRFTWVYVRAAAAPAPAPTPTPVDQQAAADAALARLKAEYPRYLSGVTVSIGATPNGYQAVCYYREGRIVVKPDHTASMEDILSHEIWHVIDWRDNGCIDWRESIPPANAADYRG